MIYSILYWPILVEKPVAIPIDPLIKIRGKRGIKYFGTGFSVSNSSYSSISYRSSIYSTSNSRFKRGLRYTEIYLADDALLLSNVPNYPIPERRLILLKRGLAKFEIVYYIETSPWW